MLRNLINSQFSIHNSQFPGWCFFLKYLDIKGKTVVDKRGEVVGIVNSLLVDIKNFRINSLVVSNTNFFNKYYIIPIKNTRCLSEYIALDSRMYRIKKGVLVKNKNIVMQSYMDREILSTNGVKFGKLIDIIFDYINGKFVAFVTSSGFFEDLFEGRKVIPISNSMKFKAKTIVIEEGSFFFRNDVNFKKYLRE
jgi:uncharacterized protein YrrD